MALPPRPRPGPGAGTRGGGEPPCRPRVRRERLLRARSGSDRGCGASGGSGPHTDEGGGPVNFRPTHGGAEEPRIEITPLIDVVFLLLIFFLLTTTFVAERTLDVDLPEGAAEGEAEAGARVVVAVAADGGLYLGQESVDLATLSERFRKAHEEDPDTALVLKADRAAQHGQVVRVMEAARAAGLTHLTILTAEPAAK
ncbi:MAG: biopolymer transporter ExbD [Deltaproteobacteria bacterium]|nr:MAG: biopolymer transporter ExbD [Deltaproteobacteria bacterium]